jgi:SAM-dependent methyltransferase
MRIERRQLLGIFLVSLSALTLEVVLTRIFSVTMWYHFAFLAVSLALMGSAVAGVVLYFLPAVARPENARRWIGLAALGLALAVPLAFLIYLRIPFQVTLNRTGLSWLQAFWLALIYLDLMVPFFLSGFTLSLALSAWAEQAGRVYWADLSGAALGCLFSIVALERLGGAGAVLAVGAVAALAGLVLASERRRRLIAALTLLTLAVLVWGTVQQGWVDISVNKAGGEEPPRVYEHWNSYSRVTVYPAVGWPHFWGLSSRYEGPSLGHMLMLIDAIAGTPIQEFHGDFSQVAFLEYDLPSFVYRLTDQPDVLVIGPGGGRDVLAALAAGATHVTAVEVNPAVIAAVRGPFAEYAGYLYERPDVTVIINDARGTIARSPQRYDVIQASLIDTWAAGGSGAFALSENSLYTVEAFEDYFRHLSDDGILTISRWYLPQRPAETLRLLSTGLAALERMGVNDPARCVAVISLPAPQISTEGLATALFRRTPFSDEELAGIRQEAEALDFAILWLPGQPPVDEVGALMTAPDRAAFIAAYPLDISPATDDRPFFFNLVRFGDLLDPALSASGVYRTSMEAILILAVVLGITTLIGALFVLLPLALGAKRRGLARPPARLLAYFGLLGVGFMLVEMPTIQRLTIYLGRPVYSLAMVLFSLLLFSGLGSLWSGRRTEEGLPRRLAWLFGLLAALTALQALGGPWLLQQTEGWPLAARLGMTVGLLAPLGFLMGMPFPSGIRWAGVHRPGVVPWLWGINGVTSVLGSALGIALAIHVGFRAVLIIAALLYGLAGALIVQEVRCGTTDDRPLTTPCR